MMWTMTKKVMSGVKRVQDRYLKGIRGAPSAGKAIAAESRSMQPYIIPNRLKCSSAIVEPNARCVTNMTAPYHQYSVAAFVHGYRAALRHR